MKDMGNEGKKSQPFMLFMVIINENSIPLRLCRTARLNSCINHYCKFFKNLKNHNHRDLR